MTSEDFKGKQVERAEQVAEQEEQEQFIEQIYWEIVKEVDKIEETRVKYAELQMLQQNFHEEQKIRMHIKSSLNASFNELINGDLEDNTIMMTSANEEKEFQMIIEIEAKENEIEEFLYDLKNSVDPEYQQIIDKYSFMQRRVIDIDRQTMRNIIFVEKIQVPRLRTSLMRVKDTGILLEMLRKESIDLAEEEEGVFQKFSNKDEKEQKAKLQELYTLPTRYPTRSDLVSYK